MYQVPYVFISVVLVTWVHIQHGLTATISNNKTHLICSSLCTTERIVSGTNRLFFSSLVCIQEAVLRIELRVS